MPSSDFGYSDFGYSDAGVAGASYQPNQVPGQGGIQDAPPGNFAGPAGYQNAQNAQNAPVQFGPQGNPNQFGYQPAPGTFNYQGSPGYQGNPGPFGQGQPGYQGTPTPIGYQDPSQFGQPGYGNRRMWSAAGAPGQGLGGGIGRLLLSILVGPGVLRRRGRNRYFWYIRIAFWLIVVGIALYAGFTKHTWFVQCTGDCGGGDQSPPDHAQHRRAAATAAKSHRRYPDSSNRANAVVRRLVAERCRVLGGELPCSGALSRGSRKVFVGIADNCRVTEALPRWDTRNHP